MAGKFDFKNAARLVGAIVNADAAVELFDERVNDVKAESCSLLATG